MNSFRPTSVSRQAYIQKVLKSQRPRDGAVFGAGQLLRQGSGVGGDLIRHSMLVIGVAGLMALAIGAITDCTIYWTMLNWVTSVFVR